MRIDTVLTMNEYFGACCVVPKHVNPPADNARHVPVTSEENIDRRSEEHRCRCDRWGHPDCLEERKPRLCAAADELLL
jgi:hypothetical protein